MKKHIQEHLKGFIGVTMLLICTVMFLASNELIAKLLPSASELTIVSCGTESEGIIEYTGNEIIPEFSQLVFKDQTDNEIIFEKDSFEIVDVINNIELGNADVEVELEGYRNSILIEDAFEIVLGKVNELNISDSSKNNVYLLWDKVVGADGYVVYKSTDKGKTYHEVQNISANSLLMYQEDIVESNAIYHYKVSAYTENENGMVFGDKSDAIRFITPLDDPAVKEIEALDCHSIKISWDLVEGAVAYKVYRGLEENGEYQLLSLVEDPSVTNFTDETCEIGADYFYYVTACQDIDGEILEGDASNIVDAQTSLDKVKLSGDDNREKTNVKLSWKSVEEAEGYEIYKKTGSSYKLVDTVKEDVRSWSESDLDAGKEYNYKVRAFITVDGQKVFGPYSEVYTKIEKINYNYSNSGSGKAGSFTSYAGYPYRWGGKSPSGWDCSGFTYWVMANEYGVNISTSTAGQAAGGRKVSVSDRSQWQVGDILVYKKGGSVNHVAIYIGNGKMIHALNDKYDTYIQGVDEYESWDANNLYSVRRYL